VAIKVKLPRRKPAVARKTRPKGWRDQLTRPWVKLAVALFLVACLVGFAVFAHYYLAYEKIVDQRIHGQIFANASRIYARPHTVFMGEKISRDEIAGELRHAGYSEDDKPGDKSLGSYKLLSSGIQINPGPESFHSQDAAIVKLKDGEVDQIAGTDGSALSAYELEPLMITSLSEQRSKRQLVRYSDIPKVLVDAVVAIEDRRFFTHGGVNYVRLAEAAWVDLREQKHKQGASTLTMQVARNFFLTREKTYRRKAVEMLISIELEQKLSKQQIFELYANGVDMGQRGSYTISGFAEASRAYFDKDLQSVNLPEAALLAGLVQAPSALSPYRHPERALERRNLVLESMVDTGAITRDEADKAKATPLKLAPPNVEASDAPYFVDLIKDGLVAKYGDRELAENTYRIYTTLDPDLQRAAAEAVQSGILGVDEQVKKLRTHRKKIGKGKEAKTEVTVAPGPEAQVALVAIDPHTGQVLALVGGRNYGMSQLDHAVAKRPTGSVFKPFVYAAAINTALNGNAQVLTASTLIDDSPGTFTYGDQIYEPRNYKDEYHGMVTARYALAHSLNNATVRLAETVGYENVATLAQAAGLTSVKATPAMALGAYDATPLDVAGAYTIFANNGIRISPTLVTSVRDAKGGLVDNFVTDKSPVLDPRVAYVMTSMMEGVINNGTAAGVRGMGFSAPAAGKTGTSHDGWFAGYTSNLLCIVWVGFDDYSDLRLSGATTAAPIWGEFMKKAVALPEYRSVQDFRQPDGVADVRVDQTSGRLAAASCPETYTVAFIAGTEPRDTCDQVPGDHRSVFSKILGIGSPAPPTQVVISGPPATNPVQPAAPPGQSAQPEGQEAKKKKGFFGKIVGIFKDDKDQQSPPPDRKGPTTPH